MEGLEGVQVNIDDLLVYANTITEHDERLRKVLKRLSEAEITLHAGKCIFGTTRIRFLGHVIDGDGIHIDEKHVEAIKEMGKPENLSELRSLLGSVNYLARFIPNLATRAHALNELLNGRNDFLWGPQQKAAFQAF